VDSNHAEIVAALRRVGCLVLDLSRVGEGCPDALVARQDGAGRKLWLMEIKTSRGQLTKPQRAFLALGWPVYIARSVDEALAVVGLSADAALRATP
jgi:hypothetical protein